MLTPENRLPSGRLLKISDIVDGDCPVIPISRCTWRRWVKANKAPQPANPSASNGNPFYWKSEDVQALLDHLRGDCQEAA